MATEGVEPSALRDEDPANKPGRTRARVRCFTLHASRCTLHAPRCMLCVPFARGRGWGCVTQQTPPNPRAHPLYRWTGRRDHGTRQHPHESHIRLVAKGVFFVPYPSWMFDPLFQNSSPIAAPHSSAKAGSKVAPMFKEDGHWVALPAGAPSPNP